MVSYIGNKDYSSMHVIMKSIGELTSKHDIQCSTQVNKKSIGQHASEYDNKWSTCKLKIKLDGRHTSQNMKLGQKLQVNKISKGLHTS